MPLSINLAQDKAAGVCRFWLENFIPPFYFPAMKLIFLMLALSLATGRAEDWIVNGKNYHNVNVIKVEPDLVSISYDGGIGRVALADLPPELQKRFNYDPIKAQAAIDEKQKQQSEVQAETTKAAERSANTINVLANVIQVTTDGFLASIISKRGPLDLCFIKCPTKGMIDGQTWNGDVIPIGTISYTDVTGAQRTVAKFSTDLSEKASEMPQFQGFARGPVSSTASVGGG